MFIGTSFAFVNSRASFAHKKSRYTLTTFTMIDILEIDNGVYVLAEKGIVSAVNKGHGSLTQAINRGIKRWELYLKTLKKLV